MPALPLFWLAGSTPCRRGRPPRGELPLAVLPLPIDGPVALVAPVRFAPPAPLAGLGVVELFRQPSGRTSRRVRNFFPFLGYRSERSSAVESPLKSPPALPDLRCDVAALVGGLLAAAAVPPRGEPPLVGLLAAAAVPPRGEPPLVGLLSA